MNCAEVFIMGKDGFDISARVNDLRSLCDYWSLQDAVGTSFQPLKLRCRIQKARVSEFQFMIFSAEQIPTLSKYMAVAVAVILRNNF
jgi:hypothetical protein